MFTGKGWLRTRRSATPPGDPPGGGYVAPSVDAQPDLPPTASGRPWLRPVLAVLLAGLVMAGALALLIPRLDGERRVPFQDFGEGTLRVVVVAQGSARSPAEHCSLVAATAAQKARGLMTRRDLGGYAAMVFPYADDVNARFYNRNVPIALTVAFFDGEGRWVSADDLEPCPDMEGCPTIGPPAPFRYAVEVEKGGLDRLGLGPGSQIAFSPGC
jgi:uncharacterized membrane protein (UPF0127 family)